MPWPGSRKGESFYTPLDAPYRGAQPPFFPPSACPEAVPVRAAWREIRAELLELLERQRLAENFDPYGFDVAGWRTLNLETYRRRYHANRRILPRTAAILDAVPGLTSAYLNVLEPQAAVPVHHGDSDAIRRCHLGLMIPSTDPDECGLEVAGERRGWSEGELLVFSDAQAHAAWNRSEQPRAILVFDVLRPEHRSRRNRICGEVLVAIALVDLRRRTRLVARLPRPLLRGLHRVLAAAVAAWLPLQRIDWLGPLRRDGRRRASQGARSA